MDNSFETDVLRRPTSIYKLEVMKASEIVVNALMSNDTDVARLIGKNACANHEPDLFFPIGGKDNPSRIRIAGIAKKICQDECAVRAQCLNIAINNGEEYGVWGGMDEFERKGLLRKVPIERARLRKNTRY